MVVVMGVAVPLAVGLVPFWDQASREALLRPVFV
jgi:hypothetical protein